MPQVLRRSCTWIKCWHSREAQGGLSCRKTQHWLHFCSVQHRTLLRGKAAYTWQTALCAESVKYNSCQFASLQSSQDGFSQQRTPLTAAWQSYCNRSLHPECHRLSSLHSGAKTDLEQPLQALLRHRLAQTGWLHLTQFYWELAWELCKYTPGSWSGQRQNHAGKRENHAGALQFLVCDCEKVKK